MQVAQVPNRTCRYVDIMEVLTYKINKAMNEKKTAPQVIYVNPRTMQVVDENYPDAVRYVREEENTRIHMDDMSFIGHAQ